MFAPTEVREGPRRRWWRRGRDERGTSLVEMTVVLLLLGIVLPVAYGVVSSVQRQEVMTTNRFTATSQIQLMADTLSKQIRAAVVPGGQTDVVVSATADSFSWYASLGNANGPTLLSVSAVQQTCTGCTASNLVEQLTQPTLANGVVTYSSTPTSSVVLGTGILVPTVSPSSDCPTGTAPVAGIFQYYQATGACLPLTASGTPLSLAAAVQPLLESVHLALTAQASSKAASSPYYPTSTVNVVVDLRNVDYQSIATTTTTP